MTVFKAFLKILKSCKVPIIMYTAFLIIFAGFNMTSSESSTSFVQSKPDVLIINNDENVGITKNLIDYIKSNSNIIDIDNDSEAIDDALFYRDVNYIIYIPNNFRADFLAHQNPQIKVKSTKDYQASLAEMMLDRYLNVANNYNNIFTSENEIIDNIDSTLKNEINVNVTTNLNVSDLSKATFYYNFTNYSILAGCVYVICLILSSFKEEKISRRTKISSIDYKKFNRILLLSNSLFALALWLIYVLLSFLLLGSIMFTVHGLIYILNSFIFTICALTIAFMIGSLIVDKNAINGIVNIVALGSSFLCGAFVPMQWLPQQVLNLAHILPSYWYIKSNELLTTLEVINFTTLKPILINMFVIILFAVFFVIITNFLTKRKKC